MININPKEISGNWEKGFTLDIHTISSELMGYNEYGHEIFDTKRSEIGELLYRLKYKSDKSVINEIVEVTVNFLVNDWGINKIIDLIIPALPSNVNRDFQPVIEVAKVISSKLSIEISTNALTKIKGTSQLKNIYDNEERQKILKDAFLVTELIVGGKNILLFDDLYSSGATLNTISCALYEQGKVASVYVLALTRTRSR